MSSEEIPALTKKTWSRRKKIIILSAISLILIILIAWYLAPTGSVPECTTMMGIIKGSTATNITFTVVSVYSCYSPSPLKSDIHVLVKDANGLLIITNEPLVSASGTHGFNYTSVSTGDYLSVGDVLSLDKTIYTPGSQLYLITPDGKNQYAILTV